MNRRQLLKTLGALAIAASLPRSIIRQWIDGEIITGDFVLREPFVAPGGQAVRFGSCHFEPAPDFVGDALLVFNSRTEVVTFDTLSLNLKGRTDIYGVLFRDGANIDNMHIGSMIFNTDDPVIDSRYLLYDAIHDGEFMFTAEGSGRFDS